LRFLYMKKSSCKENSILFTGENVFRKRKTKTLIDLITFVSN
jgi:hypothetical protein